MANLDKDIFQKEQAIRFCIVNDMTPFLEVNVQNHRELSSTSTVITDVDVLGVKIDSTGRSRRVIFDCKTLGKTSPINRAFWARGLMSFAGCDEAFIVLRKKASEAHRLSARQINVHLFDEGQFKSYATSCSIDFNIDYCYSTSISSWDKLFNAASGNPSLEMYSSFLQNEIPIEQDCVRALRKFLVAIGKIRGELDPSKPKHRAIFFNSVSIFAFLMAQVVHDLRNVIDFDADEKQFENILKFYVWGGRDSYLLRSKLAELFAIQREGAASPEPELRDWPVFMELTRKLLDSPVDIQKCMLPLREFAFMEVVDEDLNKKEYVGAYISKSKRLRQFSAIMARYLVDSNKLPKEFYTKLEDVFNTLRV